MIPAAAQGKLRYRRLNISFPDAAAFDLHREPALSQGQDQLFSRWRDA